MDNYRLCNKCKQELPITSFYRRLDDYQLTCKDCQKAKRRLDYLTNSELEKTRAKNYRKENPEKVRATRLAWKRANKEKNVASSVKYQQKNKDKHNANSKKYRQKNQDKYNEYSRIRRVKKQNNGVFIILEKELKSLWLNNCAICGSSQEKTIDHIIPISLGGRHSIGNLQILCGQCNSSKSNKVMTVWRKGLF